MPTVPTVTGPSVELQPARTVYQSGGAATVDAFGSRSAAGLIDAGRSLSGLGDQIARKTLEIQTEDNERALKALDIEFSAERRKLLFGDGTEANPGLYGRSGQAALDAAPQAGEALAKIRQQLLDRTTNSRVRTLFGELSAGQVDQELTSIARFTSAQRIEANKAIAEARKGDAMSNAAAYWNDPQRIAQSEAALRGENSTLARQEGWSEEVLASRNRMDITAMYVGVIEAAIPHDPLTAQAIYDANKDKIDGTVRPRIEKALLEVALTEIVQGHTDRIMAMGLSRTAALAEARKLKGKEEEETVDAINQRYNEAEHVSDRNYDLSQRTIAKINQEYTQAEREKNRLTDEALHEGYLAIYDGQAWDQWAVANPDKARLIEARGDVDELLRAQDAVALGNLFARTTDGTTFAGLRQMDEATLAETDLLPLRHQMTQQEWSDATNLQAGAKAALEKVRENTAVYDEGKSLLRDYAPDTLEWGSAKQTPEALAAQQAAINQMNAWITSYIERNKKLPPRSGPGSMEEKAIELMTPIASDPGWFSSEVRTIAAGIQRLTPERQAVAVVPLADIPPNILQLIDAQITAAGVTRTDDLVEQLAGAFFARDEARIQRLAPVEE